MNHELSPWMQFALRCHARTGQPLHIPASKLHLIKAPTLVLLGDNDGLIGSAADAARRARHILDCEIEIVPRAGHIMNIDEPEFIGTRIVEFLNASAPSALA